MSFKSNKKPWILWSFFFLQYLWWHFHFSEETQATFPQGALNCFVVGLEPGEGPDVCQHFPRNSTCSERAESRNVTVGLPRKKRKYSTICPLGKRSIEKKTFSFGHCPNYLTPPMTPIRATWSSFFGSRNSRFESQFRTKNTIYTVYMQPKKQLKVQYIGIFEEIDSFYWPKMHF